MTIVSIKMAQKMRFSSLLRTRFDRSIRAMELCIGLFDQGNPERTTPRLCKKNALFAQFPISNVCFVPTLSW
jgi:hypothetical protein